MSKGIWGNIQDNQGVVRSISEQDIKASMDAWLNSLHKDYAEKARELVLYTGVAVHDKIQREMQKSNDRDFADFLETNKKITVEERDRLKQMINSTEEDYYVAKRILEIKSEEFASCRHSRTVKK